MKSLGKFFVRVRLYAECLFDGKDFEQEREVLSKVVYDGLPKKFGMGSEMIGQGLSTRNKFRRT